MFTAAAYQGEVTEEVHPVSPVYIPGTTLNLILSATDADEKPQVPHLGLLYIFSLFEKNIPFNLLAAFKNVLVVIEDKRHLFSNLRVMIS